MKTENKLWTLAITLLACVIGIAVVLGFTEHYQATQSGWSHQAESERRSEEADRSIQRAGQSLTRMEQTMSDIQMQTLRTHILLLERSLEQCCSQVVELCEHESLFLDPIEE